MIIMVWELPLINVATICRWPDIATLFEGLRNIHHHQNK